MSRQNLTSNKRAFRKNERVFLDKVTDSPVEIEINDGVNPAYTITVDPRAQSPIVNSTAPVGVNIEGKRLRENRSYLDDEIR